MVKKTIVTFDDHASQRINERIVDNDYKESWKFYVDDELAFSAERYPKAEPGKVIINWKVDPKKDSYFYIGKLASLYHELSVGDYAPLIIKGKTYEVKYASFKQKVFSLHLNEKKHVEDLEEKLITKQDVVLLRFHTPYGDFGFKSPNIIRGRKKRDKYWNPQNGFLSLETHLSMPDLMSNLLANTSKYKLTSDTAMPILRRIFDHLSEYKVSH